MDTYDDSRFVSNYKKNYAALLYEYPSLAKKVDSFVKTNKDNIDYFLKSYAPARSSFDQNLKDAIASETTNFFVLLGLGTDDFFVKLRMCTPATVTILVVEKDISSFVRSLYLRDIVPVIEGWQVKFIIGIDIPCVEQEINQYYFEIDHCAVFQHPSAYDVNRDYYDRIVPLMTGFASRRTPKPPSGKKFRFLMIAGSKGTGWPYIMQDITAALHELGHSVRRLYLESGNVRQQYQKEVAANRPDYILLLDAIGLMPDEFHKDNIPYISWFFDNPFNWLAGSHVSSLYWIFVWDKTYVADLKEAGFQHVFYLPLAANPSVFYPREPQGICDVSFVGSSLWSSQEPPFAEESKKRFIKLVSRAVCKAPWIPFWSLIDLINKEAGINFFMDEPAQKREFELFIQNFARTKYRHTIINAILEFNPHLYGDEGWKNSIKDGHGMYQGRINNRIDLPVVYSSSKININITVPQLRNSFSHRAFEIPACGAFLLSDYRPEAEQFFELDREIVCFKNPDELKEKTRYYLKHDNERKKIAENGRKRVIGEHTYYIRLKQMISLLTQQ